MEETEQLVDNNIASNNALGLATVIGARKGCKQLIELLKTDLLDDLRDEIKELEAQL